MPLTSTVIPVDIAEEMRSSYLDYAMSVIVSRALPDVRDGLKPVQRRILYAMGELGMRHNSSYRKSARVVGDVLGKYHPHGDSSIYDAMVRMAQHFSLRYVFVDGQGNFGSVDGDPPAAMRYTEVRLARIAEEMLVDIDENTVDFTPNFDDSFEEPVVLPSKLPNLLINGASGIAVGMATNIPPHNLAEICAATMHLIDHPESTSEDLMEQVKGPDFPTGGIILGREGIRNAYITGHGKVVVRARVDEAKSRRGRGQIVITELPYQVNKAILVERIAMLSKDRKIEGISEVRDESDREGLRLVVDLRREAQPERVLNNLYKYTPMQSSFFINMVALVKGQPKAIDLREALNCYIDFRRDVIIRRSQFELDKAQGRAHILEGLTVALDNMERVIRLIRGSETVESARIALMAEFGLSQVQAQAILDMPLRRLAHLEREKVASEYTDLRRRISELEGVIASPEKVLSLIKQDLAELQTQYGDNRHTQIVDEEVTEFRQEELVPHQKVIVALSEQGFIKRIPAKTYSLQRRGGKGVMGMRAREEDSVRHILVADTHDSLLFFTRQGRVYCLRCYDIPEQLSRTTKGVSLVNLLPIDLSDEITALLAVTTWDSEKFLLMATRNGSVKKTALNKFAAIRRTGLIAMKLKELDELVSVKVIADSDEAIMVSQKGQAVKFKVGALRTASRTSGGVRGIRLVADHLVDMGVATPETYLLTVTEKGFGRLTPIANYPLHRRGGKGVRGYNVGEKTGKVLAAKFVCRGRGYLVMLSARGNMERIPIEGIAVQRRSSQGVRLMRLSDGDRMVSVTTDDVDLGTEGTAD